jgi:hypothetical protein
MMVGKHPLLVVGMVGKNDETSHVNFTVRQNDNA